MGVALPVIAIAATVAATAVSVYGQAQSAAAQEKAANYQAQVAQNNATIANQNADYAIKAGEEKATEVSMRNRALAGAVTAGEAANNIDVNTGSAADNRVTQRELGLTDVEQTRQNAQLQAYGYRTQTTSFEAQSQLDRMQASQAVTAGAIGATGSLLSGASSLGLKWQQLQNTGAVGGGAETGLYGPGP